VNNYRK